MEDREREERSLRFVAEHYRQDSFDARRDWLALGLGRTSWLRRNIAAASIWGIAIAACAGIATWLLVPSDTPEPNASPTHVVPATATVAPEDVNHRIEFTDATLEEVAAAVNKTYGVTLVNLPDTAQRLTLSYEGTATDLVETINALLGSAIRIEGAEDLSSNNDYNTQK